MEKKIFKETTFDEKDSNEFLLNKLEKIIAVLRLAPFDIGGLIIKSRHSETRRIALNIIEENLNAVSYTHLTLPTKRIV